MITREDLIDLKNEVDTAVIALNNAMIRATELDVKGRIKVGKEPHRPQFTVIEVQLHLRMDSPFFDEGPDSGVGP